MLSSRRGRGKGAYQRLMPISNSCPSWTSHFLTALTVKFTSRLNATKEYGGWRVNDSSVMRKERHSSPPSQPFQPTIFSTKEEISTIWGLFFPFLHLCHVAVMAGLTCELSVGARELTWLSRERVMTDFFFFSAGWCRWALKELIEFTHCILMWIKNTQES